MPENRPILGVVTANRAAADSRVAETLQLFVRMLRGFFGEQLVSVVLYGSIVFDDLAPGYGDLDFLAVVKDDLSEETCQGLMELRKTLRGGESGERDAVRSGEQVINRRNNGQFWRRRDAHHFPDNGSANGG